MRLIEVTDRDEEGAEVGRAWVNVACIVLINKLQDHDDIYGLELVGCDTAIWVNGADFEKIKAAMA